MYLPKYILPPRAKNNPYKMIKRVSQDILCTHTYIKEIDVSPMFTYTVHTIQHAIMSTFFMLHSNPFLRVYGVPIRRTKKLCNCFANVFTRLWYTYPPYKKIF